MHVRLVEFGNFCLDLFTFCRLRLLLVLALLVILLILLLDENASVVEDLSKVTLVHLKQTNLVLVRHGLRGKDSRKDLKVVLENAGFCER